MFASETIPDLDLLVKSMVNQEKILHAELADATGLDVLQSGLPYTLYRTSGEALAPEYLEVESNWTLAGGTVPVELPHPSYHIDYVQDCTTTGDTTDCGPLKIQLTEVQPDNWQQLKPTLIEANEVAWYGNFDEDHALVIARNEWQIATHLADSLVRRIIAISSSLQNTAWYHFFEQQERIWLLVGGVVVPYDPVVEVTLEAGKYADSSTVQQLYDAADALKTQSQNYIEIANDLLTLAEAAYRYAEQTGYWANTDENGNATGIDGLNDIAGEGTGYTTFWRANARDAARRLRSFTYGNGLTTVNNYDSATGQLWGIQTGFGYNRYLRDLSYQYDDANNVLWRADHLQDLQETFTYDNLDRVRSATLDGQIDGIRYTQSSNYGYDSLGNIRCKSDIDDSGIDCSAPNAVNYLYGDRDRTTNNAGPHALLSAGTDHTNYSYDLNGNLLHGGGRSLSWNSNNKPVQMSMGGTTVSFAYGPERARYKKTSTKDGSTETTFYLGKFFEKIIKSDGRTYEYKHYITGEDKAIAIHVQNGYYDGRVETPHDQTRYLHHDHLGSVDTITSSTGVVIERQSYDAFGKRREGNWRQSDPYAIDISLPTYTKRGYTGHEHIDELDLIHMNGRVYDPTLGRFLSADPHIQSPNHSQSHNRYSYVLNNPLKYTDPSGFFFKELQKFMDKYGRMVVGLAIGAIVGFQIITAFAGPQCFVGYGAMVEAAGATGVATAGAAGGAISGAMAPDATPGSILKSALIAGVSAAISFHIGQADFSQFGQFDDLARNISHGMAQGTLSALDDGDFAGGFFGAFAGHWAGENISRKIFGAPGIPRVIARTAVSAIVGGTAAEIGGGKFANGAVSAAFSHLFNSEATAGDVPISSGGGGSLADWIKKLGIRLGLGGVLSKPQVMLGVGLWASSTTNLGDSSFYNYYHGTDIVSGVALVNGAPLLVDKAAALKIDGDVGFYMASDYGSAAFFAARAGDMRKTDPFVVGFIVSGTAQTALLEAGAVLGPIPQGAFTGQFPGNQLYLPPSAFPAFDALRASGEITTYYAGDPD